MTKIILFVIALQVVLGILAKRNAAKKAAEAARTGGNAPDDADAGSTVSTASSRRPASWGEGHSEDESEDEWDEHRMRDDGESRSDTHGEHRRLPDEAPRTGHGRSNREMREEARPEARPPVPGKAAELGKDLLTQLAKELGLELPTGNRPAPRAPQPSPRPQPAPAPAPASRTAQPLKTAQAKASATQAAREAAASARMAQSRDRDRQTEISRRAAKDAQVRNARDQSGENAPRRDPRHFAVTPAQASAMHSASATARAGLMDAKSLRNAFILKTILDKPLAPLPGRSQRAK
jgi:hypothetical protein